MEFLDFTARARIRMGAYPLDDIMMKEIKVPDVINYVPCFLTLKCNLSCDYCITRDSGLVDRWEMPANEWITLNRLKLKEDLPITLQGGEPTLYEGFYEIIDKIKHPIDILTNLQFDVDEFIKKVDPKKLHKGRKDWYKSIRVSYHSLQMKAKETLEKVVKLQNAGFNIGLFALNLPELTEKNMEMSELARKKEIYFFVKDFLGKRDNRLFGFYKYPRALDGKRKKALCRSKDLLIAPGGNIYRCHRDLYHAENPIANLLDEDLKIEHKFRPCKNYGTCNPCDVKNKTNRFLQQGFCTVDIVPSEDKSYSQLEAQMKILGKKWI